MESSSEDGEVPEQMDSTTDGGVSPLILDVDDFLGPGPESIAATGAPAAGTTQAADEVSTSQSSSYEESKTTEDSSAEDPTGRLCPRCMQFVNHFRRSGSYNDVQYECPLCHETVQFRYVEDYDVVSRVKMCLGGMSGHGKTMFLRGIYAHLNSLGRRWHGFRFLPLSDEDAQAFRTAVGDNAGGRLADPSQLVERPVGFQLSGVPGIGTVHLLLYDISGEAFDTTGQLARHAFYIPRSEVVTLILSLDDMKNGQELAFLLGRLIETIRQKGQSPDQKSLVVVLTKGDRLKSDASLPKTASEFLSHEVFSDPCDMEQLQILSDELEDWLTHHPNNYWNFVQSARAEFHEVKFTIVSAIGSDPRAPGTQVEINPRNVISPLLWIFRLSLPLITVRHGGRQLAFHDFYQASQVTVESTERLEFGLGPGDFLVQQSVRFDRSVVLHGSGRDKTRLVSNRRNVQVLAAGAQFSANGLSFVTTGDAVGSTLTISDSEFNLNNCAFKGGTNERQHKGHGLLFTGKSVGEVSNCFFTTNESDGIAVTGTARVTITSCTASRNLDSGFAFSAEATVVSEKNRSYYNKYGIHVSGSVNATLTSNECFNNSEYGIVCDDDVNGLIVSNSCHNKADRRNSPIQAIGIVLIGSTRLVLKCNSCIGHRKDGIAAGRYTKSEISCNTVSNNEACGIGVYDRAAVLIDDNDCTRNRRGIFVQSTARGTTVRRNNKCFRNRRYPVQNLRSWGWGLIALWANLFNDPIGPEPPI